MDFIIQVAQIIQVTCRFLLLLTYFSTMVLILKVVLMAHTTIIKDLIVGTVDAMKI
jgi:hypothetical protein